MTAVSMAYNALKAGYFVVTNVTLDIDRIKHTVPWADKLYQHIVVRSEEYDDSGNLIRQEDFNPFSIPSGSPRGTDGGKRVLVILDECAEWFDQFANLRSPSLKRVTSWLRHTSKRSQDVVFIVQRREYINKTFRLLVSRWISVVDLNTFRIPVLKIRLPFCSDFVLATVYDKSGFRNQPLRFVRKSIFGCYYNTAECLALGGQDAVEYTIPLRHESFPFGLLIFLLATYVCLFFS